MIFVTVGTHEQQFDRLLQEVDRLAAAGALPHEVFCQTGYSSYTPAVPHASMLTYEEMQERIAAASLVISHGGPGSILPALAGDTPLVMVPRRHRFGEHVDDHQVNFCHRIGRARGLPVVEEIAALESAVRFALSGRARRESPAEHMPERAVAELGRRIAALTARRR